MADEEPSTERAPEAPPRPKKKKKRAKRDQAATASGAEKGKKPAPELLPGEGTPDGDKLREAVRAFDAGDYARVRELTDTLARSDEPEIRKAAARLRDRIGVDPIQVAVVLACAAVLAVIVFVWVL